MYGSTVELSSKMKRRSSHGEWTNSNEFEIDDLQTLFFHFSSDDLINDLLLTVNLGQTNLRETIVSHRVHCAGQAGRRTVEVCITATRKLS